MRPKIRLYADELVRVSTSRLRVEVGPKRWRNAKFVHLEAEGIVADVRTRDVPASNTYGGMRRFLECPRCLRLCFTLGAVPGLGWSCRTCGGWRGRDRWKIPSRAEPSPGRP